MLLFLDMLARKTEVWQTELRMKKQTLGDDDQECATRVGTLLHTHTAVYSIYRKRMGGPPGRRVGPALPKGPARRRIT